jgi:hypothetical protein
MAVAGGLRAAEVNAALEKAFMPRDMMTIYFARRVAFAPE